ncbi:MAG: hypothetical protein JXQ75_06280 [Phycisphaerae bacterium]|nr:hypothetical protein [Phycisphaerae bacterium]
MAIDMESLPPPLPSTSTPAPPAKQEVRLGDLEAWLRNFAALRGESGETIGYMANSAQMINECYWNTVEKYVRPKLKNNRKCHVDHHKIIAALEMTIMFLLPIEHEDQEKALTLNAELALFIGKTILQSWSKGRLSIDAVIDLNRAFDREHVAWLKEASPENFPIFANACVWYLFEDSCYERARNLPVGYC